MAREKSLEQLKAKLRKDWRYRMWHALLSPYFWWFDLRMRLDKWIRRHVDVPEPHCSYGLLCFRRAQWMITNVIGHREREIYYACDRHAGKLLSDYHMNYVEAIE